MGPPVLVQPRRKSIAMFGGGPLRTIVKPSTREPLSIDMDRLRPYFHLPQKLAAAHLGLSLTALKTTCRKLGIGSWAQARAEDAARLPAAQECNKPEMQIPANAQMHETSCTFATATSDASAAAATTAHTALPTKAFVEKCKHSVKSLEECGLDPDPALSWTACTSLLDPVRPPSPRTTSRASSSSLYSADTTLNATAQTARLCYKSVHGAGFQRVAESDLVDARLAGWRRAQELRTRKIRRLDSDDLLDPPLHSGDCDAASNLVASTASRPVLLDPNDMRVLFAEPFLHDLPHLPDDGMALNTEQATRCLSHCRVDCDFSEAAGSAQEVPDDNKTDRSLLQEDGVDDCLVRLLQSHASCVDPAELEFWSDDLSFLGAVSAVNPRQDQRGDRRPQQAAHSSV